MRNGKIALNRHIGAIYLVGSDKQNFRNEVEKDFDGPDWEDCKVCCIHLQREIYKEKEDAIKVIVDTANFSDFLDKFQHYWRKNKCTKDKLYLYCTTSSRQKLSSDNVNRLHAADMQFWDSIVECSIPQFPQTV